MVSTTRPIICFTERSRSGEAMRPRKYFWETMFVAVCDQNFGNSTSFCSNAGPSLPGMCAWRSSHSISSNGSRPGMVKKRRGATVASESTIVFTTSSSAAFAVTCACSAVAIVSSRTEFDITSSRPGERCSSCERVRDDRARAGRCGKRKKSLQNRQNACEASFYPDGVFRRCRRGLYWSVLLVATRPGGGARCTRDRPQRAAQTTVRRARAGGAESTSRDSPPRLTPECFVRVPSRPMLAPPS